MTSSALSSCTESAVIPCRSDQAWHVLAELDFKWWSLVDKVEGPKDGKTVGGMFKFYFKDKTIITYQLMEVSFIHKCIAFQRIESDPAEPGLMGLVHSIRLRDVTTSHETFVEWTTDLALEVVAGKWSPDAWHDVKYKQQEGIVDLQKFCAALK